MVKHGDDNTDSPFKKKGYQLGSVLCSSHFKFDWELVKIEVNCLYEKRIITLSHENSENYGV